MSQPSSTQVRHFVFDLEHRSSDDAIPVVVSSDSVVEVSDGPEILVHTADAIDLRRAPLPIIATHRGGQVNVGIVDGLQIEGGRLRGMARFGVRQEATEYRTDVLNQIIRSVSVGYARIKAKVREDGVLVTTRWMPTHTALVAEPADINAGFFRSLDTVPAFELETLSTAAPPQVNTPAASAASTRSATMAEVNTAAGQVAEPQAEQTRSAVPMPEGTPGNRALDIEKDRRRGIENLCKATNMDDNLRDLWIGTGLPISKITEDIMQIQAQRAESNKHKQVSNLGLSSGETQRFSLMAAVRACVDKNWAQAGFELECSREISKRVGKVQDPNRFYVPMDVQRRDLTVASGSGGGYLVETANMSFIDVLRNRSVAMKMGATRLTGLVGSVTVPKQTTAATAYWLASESTAITEGNQVFGQMALSPKTVGAYTEISRQLLLQSSPSAEAIVTSDLAKTTAIAVDLGVLAGSGGSGQPQGIIGTSGIGSVTGTSLAASGVLEFQSDVASGNVTPDNFGYVTTPVVAALLMARPELPSTGTTRLWTGNLWDGALFGLPAMSSAQMSAGTMLAGDWSQVVIAEWGVLEIETNPYANFAAGIVGVRAITTIDVGVRYAAAFSYASSIT
jgi:HK97 family phage major capsid protein